MSAPHSVQPKKQQPSLNADTPQLLRRLSDAMARMIQRMELCSGSPELKNSRVPLSILLVAARMLHKSEPEDSAYNRAIIVESVCSLYENVSRFTAIDNASSREWLHNCNPDLALRTLSDDTLRLLWSDLCDPELDVLWQQPTTPGYAYQYLQRPSRRSAQTRVQTANKKTSQDELAAFTQLYTPSWVVDFLLAETVSAHINSGAAPASITVLDPACGAGHFLIRALDLLVQARTAGGEALSQAVEEVISQQLFGADIDTGALWTCAVSVLVRAATLTGEMPSYRWNHLQDVSANSLGSLDRDLKEPNILGRKFDVVVTNPPYIGRKLISRALKDALKKQYPDSCHDLCTAFVERGFDLLCQGGRYGYITQASILSLPSYRPLRNLIAHRSHLSQVVELGSGVFPLQGGEKVNSVLLLGRALPPVAPKILTGETTLFVDLTRHCQRQQFLDGTITDCNDRNGHAPADSNHRNLEAKHVYEHLIEKFHVSPHFSFYYRCPPFLLKLIEQAQPLSETADVRQGLATTDNDRFLRYFWQVNAEEIGRTWFPYIKGAGTERWTSPILHVVNWRDGGREIKETVAQKYPYLKGKTAWVVKNEQYYFREGLCFSFVSTEQFAVRRLPPGCIFDVAASAIFVDNDLIDFYAGYLNSSLLRAICKLINPTINVQVGDIKRLPMFELTAKAKKTIAATASECTSLKQSIDMIVSPSLMSSNTGPTPNLLVLTSLLSSNDAATDARKLLLNLQASRDRLAALERSNDELLLDQLALHSKLTKEQQLELRRWAECETTPRTTSTDRLTEETLAQRLMLFAVETAQGQPHTHVPAQEMISSLSLSESAAQWFCQVWKQQSIDDLFPETYNRIAKSFYRNKPSMIAL